MREIIREACHAFGGPPFGPSDMTIDEVAGPIASYPSVLLPLQSGVNEPSTPSGVAVMGLGYVGLPTSIGFADAGLPVIAYDVDPVRLRRIQAEDVDLLE